MPVLFQFPRSTRSSKARPLHSAMRKSGAKSIRRRMKTVHFASTKTLLSAPRTPPTLPLIPYDTQGHSPQSASYPRGLHTPNASYDSGTTLASSGGPYTPSPSSSPYHRTGANTQHLSPDLVAYYQPSSSTLKPLPTSTAPKVVHAETVPLEVEWDCAWDGEPERGGKVVKRGREKIPREKLPKTPHPKKAIDLEMPGLSPSVGSYFPAEYTVSEAGNQERGRGRGREMLDRLRGRSRSHSQQPQGHRLAPPPQPQPQSHAYPQHGAGAGGSGLLQVPQRQRRGSLSSSSGSGVQMQMSSSAPTASYMNAHMRPPPSSSPHTHHLHPGHGQVGAYMYPAPTNVASSPSGHGHTRSRTSSLNVYPHPQQPSPQHQHSPQHQQQQTHHRHHSASAYPAPPPNVRRRSSSHPPETRRAAYAPGASPTASHMESQSQSHGGAHMPQMHSASPYLIVPARGRDGSEHTSGSGSGSGGGGGRRRAGSFSYGAPPPPPSPHTSLNGHGHGKSSGAHSAGLRAPPPPMLRRRTASNPHLPSSGRHSHQPRQRTTAPHRYLAVPTTSSHSSHASQPQISWDMRLPPSTATRARGAADAKGRVTVHFLSAQALGEPATSPPCAFMRVSATRVHAGGSGKREGWPWPIAIYPHPTHEGSPGANGGGVITLHDVLHALHAALRARASEKEYERLLPDRMDKRAVSTAYEGRWREESRVELAGGGKSHGHQGGHDKSSKAGVGLRRVDFLRGRTVFVGLEPVGGVEGEWCLVVR